MTASPTTPAPPADAPDLLGLPREALARLLDRLGIGAHHAGRVFRGLHRDRRALRDIPDLGRHAARLEGATWSATTGVEAVHTDDTTTRRLVVRLHDGARVECVLVPMRPGRWTLCISTQVGCAMACRFCATGTLGLTRHLRAGEVVAQVHAARGHLAAVHPGDRITRLVYMGMGEPLHAYDTTRDSLRVLLDDHGVNFGSKQVVVSTVGLPVAMRRFAEDFGGRVGLALSLHAGTDATRAQIVPAARAAPLARLKGVLRDHPLPGTRKLMLECVVLPGVNDTDAELDGLAAFAEGLPAVVNLIPFNPFPGAPYRSPAPDEVVAMGDALRARGTPASIRWPRGRGVDGACGQLALRAATGGSPTATPAG